MRVLVWGQVVVVVGGDAGRDSLGAGLRESSVSRVERPGCPGGGSAALAPMGSGFAQGSGVGSTRPRPWCLRETLAFSRLQSGRFCRSLACELSTSPCEARQKGYGEPQGGYVSRHFGGVDTRRFWVIVPKYRDGTISDRRQMASSSGKRSSLRPCPPSRNLAIVFPHRPGLSTKRLRASVRCRPSCPVALSPSESMSVSRSQ